MPRGSTYADNASNRRLGRAGMAMGSAPVSSGSSGSATYYGGSGSATRNYVDNQANRNLGRVGMPHGSAPVSRTSGRDDSRTRIYVDNSSNRNLGRVGMPHGSAPVSRTSGRNNSGTRTYVDNPTNRNLGRVGMALGSASVSGSSGSNYSGTRTYVDNPTNQNLGRVGMPHGSAPVSRTSGRNDSGTKTYVDNPTNRNLGRVGMALGSAPASRSSADKASSKKTYIDNAANRNLGRVGIPVGSLQTSKSSANARQQILSTQPRTYVDNAVNRMLNRVGKPLGSVPIKSVKVPRTYVDNPLNRTLSRVGLRVGSKPISKLSVVHGQTQSSGSEKVYVDNPANRRLGRVGLPLGSMPVSSSSRKEKDYIKNAYQQLVQNPHDDFQDSLSSFEGDSKERIMAALEEFINRMNVWQEYCQQRYAEVDNTSVCSLNTTTGTLVADLQESCISSILSERQTVIPNLQQSQSQSIPFQSYEGVVIQFNELILEKKIGQGGFGDVHAGKWGGKTVAIKKLRVQRVSKKRSSQFESEIKVFCKLFHKNIITFYGACIKTPNLCIVMEFMEGSLYDQLHVAEKQFHGEQKSFIIHEIACGLKYLHKEGVAHADMKSSNILLNTFEDDIASVKITDFGLSMMKNDSETTSSSSGTAVRGIGTPRYMAPEILRGDPVDRNKLMKADVYSFGLIMFEVFSEEEPFEKLNLLQLQRQVGEGVLEPDLCGLNVDDRVISLMRLCWSRKPETRPSADECYNWLAAKVSEF